MNPEDLETYIRGVREQDRRLLSKTITLIESSRPDHQQRARKIVDQLLPHTGNAVRLGITGVPGVGKSTFIESLGISLVEAGHRVAVLAVDPSSSRSGGSVMADKTRMEKLSVEQKAFIRPSPSGGTLGGVARKTRETMLVCEAAGFDVIIVETVGVGQSETTVAQWNCPLPWPLTKRTATTLQMRKRPQKYMQAPCRCCTLPRPTGNRRC